MEEKELQEVLDNHQLWVTSNGEEGEKAFLVGANLEGKDLQGVNLQEADLIEANLKNANLQNAQLYKANLYSSNLEGANLKKANLSHANLFDATLRNADLLGSNLTKANLIKAQLQGCQLQKCELRKTNLMEAHLEGAQLQESDLQDAVLWKAILPKASLENADLRGTNLIGADMTSCCVTDLQFNRKGKYKGIRLTGSFGNEQFIRFAHDQSYIEEFHSASLFNRFLYWLWLISSDCGRSLLLWGLWSLIMAIGYAIVYFYVLGPDSFVLSKYLAPTFGTMVYHSIITFTTLDLGDFIPKTVVASWWIAAEVLTGYIMLGGWISILANKLARRA